MRRLQLSLALGGLLIGSAAYIVAAQDVVTEQVNVMAAQLEKQGAKRLVKEAARGSFSPDGKQIAYAKMPFNTGIALLDLETGKSTDLVAPGKDPAFSHGENPLIAYVRGDGREEEVWVVQPDGQNNRKIAAGGFPCWSGDGKTLFFHNRNQLCLMAVDFSKKDPQPEERDLIIPALYPEVSPNGKTVAYVSRGAFIITPIENPRYTAQLLPGATRGGFAGWSADGKQVAYGGFGYDDRVGLWVYDTETGNTRKVLDGPCTMAAWSQDGSKLLFDFRPFYGWHEVWMIETKALEPEQKPEENSVQTTSGQQDVVLETSKSVE